MNPGDEQLAAVRDLARAVVAGAGPASATRVASGPAAEPGFDLDRGFARAGLLGLEVADEYGGGGGTFAELAVVLEVLGENAGMSTLLSSAVLCAGALTHAGSPAQRQRWLPSLAEGRVTGTVALGPWITPEATTDRVTAIRTPGAWALTGRLGAVPDVQVSGLILVPACIEGGFLVALTEPSAPGLAITPRPQTDETRCLGDIELDAVVVPDAEVLALDGPGDAAASRLLGALVNRAAAAIAADSLGNARKVLSMTVQHVRTRRQFGRPIGSFQAVKHQMADMLVNIETSAALVEEAVRHVVRDPFSCHAVVSMAKDHACRLAARNAGTALQLHGGIGYTWEYGLHRYLKRALLNEFLYGDSRRHRDRILRELIER